MKCAECENTKFCELYLNEPKMGGCTSGNPKYTPKNMAIRVKDMIIHASNAINMKYDDYFELIKKEM